MDEFGVIVYDDRRHRNDELGYVGSRACLDDISIVIADITSLEVDAIVNAANEGLRAGGGVCGAIFKAAGKRDLRAACDEISHCDTGSAVITPGFALKARYVIHAVGPRWSGGTQGEPELLASCYTKSLDLAAANGCTSVAFPLISSGIFGYPKRDAWRVALMTCADWLHEHKAQDMDVSFCVLSKDSRELAYDVLGELGFPRD